MSFFNVLKAENRQKTGGVYLYDFYQFNTIDLKLISHFSAAKKLKNAVSMQHATRHEMHDVNATFVFAMLAREIASKCSALRMSERE